MPTATVTLESMSPLSQSKFHDTEKLPKERPDEYEKRTWRNRLHVNEKGNVIIPPMMLKKCLEAAALYLGIKIPGKGNAKYTKHFKAGILVVDPIDLGIKPEEIKGEWLLLDSRGKSGSSSSTRVKKCCTRIDHWKGTAIYHILDEEITKDIFRQVLEESGKLIGLGRFRPINGGFYGRYKVNKIIWE